MRRDWRTARRFRRGRGGDCGSEARNQNRRKADPSRYCGRSREIQAAKTRVCDQRHPPKHNGKDPEEGPSRSLQRHLRRSTSTAVAIAPKRRTRTGQLHNLQLQKSPSRIFGQNSGNSADISKAFFEMGNGKFESFQVGVGANRTRVFLSHFAMRKISWVRSRGRTCQRWMVPRGRRKHVPLASRTDLYDRPLLATVVSTGRRNTLS